MEKIPSIGAYHSMVEPFHCDISKHLFLSNLGNHLLNAADKHSTERGYGMNFLHTIQRTWVLSRLAIEMEEMPSLYDSLTIETWINSVMRFFTSRNFKIIGEKGKVLGHGKSIWAMINTENRQPVDILSMQDGTIKEYIDAEYACPIDAASRVIIQEVGELKAQLHVAYHDIDMNGHFNSIKYIEHALNLWSTDWHQTHFVKRMEVAYVAEAHQGDVLYFYQHQQLSEAEIKSYSVKITKRTENEEETEVCRINFKFATK
ncbi:MAG: thioesterase [Prevotella sp.]|nr:thioesterase [Prevotellaceae bacterium]MDY3936687.1 thioesterase [Prevotella sp.]